MLAVMSVAPTVIGATLADEPQLYAQLQAAKLRSAGRLQGAQFEVDRATFSFDDGELYLLEPVAGQITGAVYLGDGNITITPPDGVGRQQVDKFLERETIDLEFDAVVMRFSDGSGERLADLTTPARKPDLKKATKVWRQRHDKALDERLANLDGRIVQALANGAADPAAADEPYFFADIDAKGWFVFELDSFNPEEIRVYKSYGQRRHWDNWAAFHSQRDYSSATTGQLALLPDEEHWEPTTAVSDIAIDAAVDGRGKIEATAELRVRALRRLGSVRLSISPILEVDEVRWLPSVPAAQWPGEDWARISTGAADEPHPPDGETLEFVQAHIDHGWQEDRWEPRVTVVLPEPVGAGQEFVLQVRYHGKLFEKLLNRDFINRDSTGWYPKPVHVRRARFHTVFRLPKKYGVATGGTLQEETEIDGTRIERRVIGAPIVAMAFQYGAIDTDVHTPEGHPPITIHSSDNMTGFAPGNRRRVLNDITGATKLFSEYFGPVPFDHLVLTETPAFGGQSFPGFVLLSFGTFGSMHTGEAELFRTHELAHQWWGNSVSWSSYHDQWISEGFAQYSAALHRLLARDEAKEFDDMMEAWRKDVLAKPSIGQRFGLRHYGFSPEALRKSDGPESGPVWAGFRLASDKTPNDYRLLAYEKGAYILHMLRMLLYDFDTDTDQRFRDMMTTFQMRHRGGHASTEDFLVAVNEAFAEPMDWFFDQWIYGTEVPEYKPDLDFRRVDGTWRLQGTIRQLEVAPTFRMPVPIRIHFKDHESLVVRVMVDRPTVEVDIALDGSPDEFDFNVLNSVLAR